MARSRDGKDEQACPPREIWHWFTGELYWAWNGGRRGWVMGGIAWGLVIGGMPVYPGIWHLMAGRWVEGGVITGVGVLIVLAVSLGNWWVERKAS